MKTSELIALLKNQLENHGDNEIAIVHPTGVYYDFEVLNGTTDYYNSGLGLLGGNLVGDFTVIDYV